MIEINNEELAKVLNLWTGTEDWSVTQKKLFCAGWIQRETDNYVIEPTLLSQDNEAHALVNFMLKERKYPNGGGQVFYNSAEGYTAWVRVWEKRFGDMSQEELCIPPSEQVVDHSIPVRYDHLISTEELVKRAQERWPEDGWVVARDNEIEAKKSGRTFSGEPWGIGILFDSEGVGGQTEWGELRTKLLTIISEAEKTTPEILDEQPQELVGTKAERFYQFLTTRQDSSAGLWGIVAMELQAPVRGGCGGWAKTNIGALTYSDCEGWTGHDVKGLNKQCGAIVMVEV